jgi:hypothetical protein
VVDTTGSVFTIDFGMGRTALAARIADTTELAAAIREFGLTAPRPVVVVVGGADGMSDEDAHRMWTVVKDSLLSIISAGGAVVVDGGTHAGVMRVMGQARDGFPLIGVAVERTVVLPGRTASSADAASLEPHHSHFLFVPGTDWGHEAPWLARAATVVAGTAPSFTLLVNGGDTSVEDAWQSLQSDRPVLVLAGTGRMADRIAAARNGIRCDERVNGLADSPQVHIVDVSDPDAVRERLIALLPAGR